MKKLVILGAGESGIGAALLAQAKGLAVFVSDVGTIASPYRQELVDHGIAFEESQHTWERVLAADEVVKSPGIPHDLALIQAIKQAGIPIIDEIELASRYTQAFLVVITGSNGKTTTTHLAYHLLREAGLDVGIAGNMGASFARKVLETEHKYYVLELSCFQLAGMYNFKADIACLLNITPDHLNRYGYQMALYIQAKLRLLQNMSEQEHFIYSQDDTNIQTYLQTIPIIPAKHPISLAAKAMHGAYEHAEYWHFALTDQAFQIPIDALKLPGRHNRANAMAAIAVASLLGIAPSAIIAALQTFKGMPHRIEWVAQVQGIDCYNDSKSTNVEAAYAALSSFNQPIIWIAGGYDKGNDYALLQPLVKERVKVLICLGKDNRPLRQAFQGLVNPIHETQQMEEAASLALSLAQPGEVVLLSPACASFDLFKSFEDRGESFKKAVYQAQLTHNSLSNDPMD